MYNSEQYPVLKVVAGLLLTPCVCAVLWQTLVFIAFTVSHLR